ncbi:MAG: bifunctional phosphoribosylaminoimidazolecarboxamide formyltransferase/inosine monophosphate cyclohydrolase [Rhodobacteraceae bacterium]|nr:bifunctional phosphoribosylaminoimidazolecarboxamide formyltransferase/inosine monophosphate cyclohydrolase [Paracoccaceae bacterium]OUU62542.1 MAG: bifunctional phosphoribosylaminoimidazolecarboxamide formyltransferase/IMP cyclohydrolase [Alphaproteobacteria bacterium TMED62]|tara:strand:+ start:16164 stop:17735 length:1572 start_codon:yes stop_codon:yes gene_type:complete
MSKTLIIRKSLISVSDKKNIVSFAKELVKYNVEIISTGNTFKHLKKNKVYTKNIESVTSFPEILNGRVKTLHPKVFGGILANNEDKSHLKQLNKHAISEIQLVVVNLYPFQNTIRVTKDINKCIENIDIGGPSLIRAAAKNFFSTAVITDLDDYKKVIKDIKKFGGISLELRRLLALKAFKKTMLYDREIFKWFAGNIENSKDEYLFIDGKKIHDLRYGENPHQDASIYSFDINDQDRFFKQIHGKELSFNNLNDLRAALSLLAEFKNPSAVIIKHAIPSGVAESNNIYNACIKALQADELSAFGGVVSLNGSVDKKLALKLSAIFLEVIAAKSFTKEAIEILSQKKNLRIIKILNLKKFEKSRPQNIITMPDVFLVQNSDIASINKKNIKIVSKRKPTKLEIDDLIFANKIVKHVRSNAIVLAKNRVTLGIGSGNTSRIDSVNFAIQKSSRANIKNKKNFLSGAVMASDAFFPFPDSIILAYKAGIKSVIQPGGSIKDDIVIKEVNKKNISMVFTFKRSFSH